MTNMVVFKYLAIITCLLGACYFNVQMQPLHLSNSGNDVSRAANNQESEEEELQLRLIRNFGYSSGSGKIQGSFTLTATSNVDLERVRFFIDGKQIAVVTEPPFQLRFNTGEFALGEHLFEAVGTTRAGQDVRSNQIRVEFVTPEEGWQSAMRILVPVLAILGLAMVASFGLTFFAGRGRKSQLALGAPRNYGLLGGAICPQCHRPFALHLFGINLIVGKLDRCPYCGRWSLVRRATLNELRLAEEAELQASASTRDTEAVEKGETLIQELEDSRYLDL